jgi:ADP-heptose:LPS heptosyltransferase/Flp pilus assembly protein TadD
MDVVVSVDTAVAHLAGALGVPLFVLLHAHADWRWLLDRDDSPWYPSARLLRQQSLGDWGAPLGALSQALQDHLAQRDDLAHVEPRRGDSTERPHVAVTPPACSTIAPPADLRPDRQRVRAASMDWRDDARLQQLQAAARLAPGDAAAQFNLGLRYLALGRFDEGWNCYEWRQAVPRLFTPMPEGGAFWDGSQELAGKTLLLCHEQGLGDVIQFCRFVPYLARHGARILLGVPPTLAPLMGSLDGVAHVISGAEAVPDFDLKCLLMSAAQRLAVTPERPPAHIPYLAASPECLVQWSQRLESGARPVRIGIACSGNAAHAGDALRSLPLDRLAAALAPLCAAAAAPGMELHLVQDSLRPADLAALPASGVIDHRHRLTDMAETAALMAHLDAVVSVDTAVAHLAGALGVPLFLLLPDDCDWRWMLDRDDSPWYPSARLLRCSAESGWEGPLARLPGAIDTLLRAHGTRDAHRPCGKPAAGAGSQARGAFSGYPIMAIGRSNVAPPDLGAMLAEASRWHREGDRARAIAAYRRVIAHDPLVFDAQRLLGAALFQDMQPDQALPVLEQALALRADSDEVWSLHGNCLGLLGRHEEAIESLERARALRPDKAEIWNALGRQLQALGRWDAADAHYDRAVTLDPARPQYRLNRALVCLLIGDFAAGWTDWEARLAVPGSAPDFAVQCPRWDGIAPLAGKSVLLVCEQGLGDTIHFARYAPLLAARGARVLLGVPAPLRTFIASLGEAVTVVSDGDPLPHIDYTFPLMSLGRIAATRAESIPWTGPYLHAPADRVAHWAARLATPAEAAAPRRRLGLVFSGNKDHANDAERSIPLERLAPILGSTAGRACQWHLLQPDVRVEDEPWLQRLGVIDHRAALGDFAETAALAANLDGVVSVDTSVAHLAGALGLPLYLLLAFNPDWRWMLERGDSPWYPSAQLLRQAVRGDWSDPLRRLGQLVFAS